MKTSRRIRGAMVVCLGAMIASVSGGCSSPVEGSAKDAVTAKEEANLDAVDAPQEMVARNPLEGLFRESLADVRLRPDQQERIRKIRSETTEKLADARDARRVAVLAVAEGVAAGQLDDAKVQQSIEALVREVDEAKPVVQDGLNQLHATLDADQRAQLVRSLRTKGMQLQQRGQARGGPRGVVKARLGKLAEQLELTAEQKVAIRDRARDEFRGAAAFESPDRIRDRMRDRMREVGTAFLTDDFDAKALDVGKEGPEATRKVATAMVRFLKVVLPELNAAQRTKLSALIRARGEDLRTLE